MAQLFCLRGCGQLRKDPDGVDPCDICQKNSDGCLTLRCSRCDLWLCTCCQCNLDQANSRDNDSSSDDSPETPGAVGAVPGSADDSDHDTDSDTGVVSGAGAVAVVVSAPTSVVDIPFLPKDVYVASIKSLQRSGGGDR